MYLEISRLYFSRMILLILSIIEVNEMKGIILVKFFL